MKICLIGGLGFIGHSLANRLVDKHDVIIIDNKTDYNSLDKNELAWLFPSRTNRVKNSKIYIEDVNNHTVINKILTTELPDCVVYLAAYPRAKLVDDNIDLATKTMISALENVAITSKNINAHFGFISSSMIYGEWPSFAIDENCKPNPVGNYGNLKYLGEWLLKIIYPSDNFFITRLTGVYGPWDATDRVASRMFKAAIDNTEIAVHGKETKLDLTYIDDVTAALESAIVNRNSGTFNISSGTATTLLELAMLIKKITNSNSVINVTDHDKRYPQRGALLHTKAEKILGYKPSTTLEVGLQQYYDWLLKH